MIEGGEIVYGLLHEGMAFGGEHEVVGDPDRNSLGEDDGMNKELVHWAEAADVQVDVNPSVVMQHEVSNGVGALYHVWVVVISVQKPRIVLLDKLS